MSVIRAQTKVLLPTGNFDMQDWPVFVKHGGAVMYPPGPHRKRDDRSMFRAPEPEKRSAASESFQQQADIALSGVSPKAAFSKACEEKAQDGLPSLTIVSDKAGGAKTNTEQAVNASGCSEALKGMNTDTDQINQMMALNATPELFQELKDQDRDQAADLAVRDPNFQRQALHDTGDEAFADRVRSRIGGSTDG